MVFFYANMKEVQQKMKQTICGLTGMIGSWIATAFGGWDYGIGTLVLFMAADYISGLVVAAVFRTSNKTKSGGLQSRAGFKGLCRKCMTLVFVLIAHRLDLVIGTSYIRDAVVIGFIANELISIIENAGLMGVSLPPVLIKAVDILQEKTKKESEE